MARDEVARAAETAWNAAKRILLESVDDPSSALRTRIADSVVHIGESLRDDADLRDKVDNWIVRGRSAPGHAVWGGDHNDHHRHHRAVGRRRGQPAHRTACRP